MDLIFPAETRMLSYSEDQEGHPRLLRMASELVGVAGFEPAASSSRTKEGQQAGSLILGLACEFTPQDDSAPPTVTRARDAWLTHAPDLPRRTAR